MPVAGTTIRKLLGLEQFEMLKTAFIRNSSAGPNANLHTFQIAAAILISLIPGLAFFLAPQFTHVDFTTVLVGVSACLAVLYRIRSKIPFGSVTEWVHSLKLTHFGFALGCVPLVFLLLWDPLAFGRLALEPNSSASGTAPPPTMWNMFSFIFGVAAWAALTEELIYRGLLISVLRRWNRISSPIVRDWFAIVISASIFGLVHFATWGPTLSLALVGLGIGLGVAYIAAGELVLPLIVYHLIFDALSLSAAMFLR